MKKVLIISTHYPPSNLAAVHRSRLFALHLPAFGWQPIILTVDEKFYEEKLDWNLHKLLPVEQRIEKVKAYAVTKPRLIGDIGLRGFFQLRKRALELVQKEQIDFVYIPIPSFYVSLIGSYLHRKTGVKFGIDYIDPWVHEFPGSNKIFSRHWFSTKLAKWLEPKAVKNASLITGVAGGYYKGVIDRNPKLTTTCLFGAMPYGGEIRDHEMVKQMHLKPYLFQKESGVIQFVYAGAFLPKAIEPLRAIFKSIKKNKEMFKNIRFHFIGTGRNASDANSYSVKPIAEEFGLWNNVVKEYPARIPYLDVLTHLEASDAIFVLGSTEPHYTPSKVYQGVLSKKPIVAVLHEQSTAVDIIRSTNAGVILTFKGETELKKIEDEFFGFYQLAQSFLEKFIPENVNISLFKQYSAVSVTAKLSDLLNESIQGA